MLRIVGVRIVVLPQASTKERAAVRNAAIPAAIRRLHESSERTKRMIGALARKFFGSANERGIKGYLPRVEKINALEGTRSTWFASAICRWMLA